MVAGGDDWPIPATAEQVADVVRMFRGNVHGWTDTELDAEFPNIIVAASFASTTRNGYGWTVGLRKGDSVTSLDHAVTLTVWLQRD